MSRVKSKAFWEKHMGEYLKSGMSQNEYCSRRGLKPRSLQYHLKKDRLTGSQNSKSLEKISNWLPMTIIDEPEKPGASGGIRLQISEITLEADQGFNGAHLAHILRAIGAAC